MASGAQHPHRQTDRQRPGPGWSLRQRLRQQKPQKPAAQRKGSVDSPGPEDSPRPRRPRALGTPAGMEGSGSGSCKTLWGPRAGEAPVPRGGPGAHGSVRALAGVPLQARFAAAALGAAAGARDAGSAPPSLSCEDRCARHADDIPKTAARSQATPRPGLCSPWSGHAPPNPDRVSLRGHAERPPPQQGGLNDPGVTCLAASFVPPHVGTRDMHGRALCPTNEVLHNHDV